MGSRYENVLYILAQDEFMEAAEYIAVLYERCMFSFYSFSLKSFSYSFLDQGKIPLPMITTMKKFKSGYINGTRVSLGNLNDFLSTSCITNLSFLSSAEDGRPDKLHPEVITIQVARVNSFLERGCNI